MERLKMDRGEQHDDGEAVRGHGDEDGDVKRPQVRKLHAMVLAAGYGTRLERDIIADTSGHFAHLLGLPKALVPVGGKEVITYWLEAFRRHGDVVAGTWVVCNALHHRLFQAWAERTSFSQDCIVNDGTTSNETRRGAIADIQLVIETIEQHQKQQQQPHEYGLVVVAGDTLFTRKFDLSALVRRFEEVTDSSGGAASMITYYMLSDHNEVSKRGVVEVDEQGRVTSFLEKPKPDSTNSNMACPPLYFFGPKVLPMFKQYVDDARGTLAALDAPGAFLAWLASRATVFAVPIDGRFDIGGLADYVTADRYFSSQQ